MNEREEHEVRTAIARVDASLKDDEEVVVKTTFVIKEGKRVAVLRPADAALAISLATAAKSEADFSAVLQAQQYTYEGFLAIDSSGKGYLADPNTGAKLGELLAGDSFIPEDQRVSVESGEAPPT